MNTVETIQLQPETVREALRSFWNEVLEIEPTRDGLAMAVPLSYPDGWQIVVEVRSVSPTVGLLTDGGRTLNRLFEAGQGFHQGGSTNNDLLCQQLEAFEIQRDGFEIFRQIPLPPQGIDIRLFAEALASIAHLIYRHEPLAESEAIARRTVEKVFAERHLQPAKNHRLVGRLEKRITVDYFVEGARPAAVQVISRRGNIQGYMEQWGFRWRDLHDAAPAIQRAMVYDPAVQQIDESVLAIGHDVFELCCPYHETGLVHEFLDRAGVGG